MRNKKGVDISINAVIVAVIALLVLVVLAIIFTGRLGSFSQQAGSCLAKGGKCAIACGSSDYNTVNQPTEDPTTTCAKASDGSSQRCCIAVPK